LNWRIDPAKALRPEEAIRVFNTAKMSAEAGRANGRFRQARNGHLVLFILATGARITEALGARVEDVTLRRDGGEVRLRLLKRKKRTYRLAMLTPADTADLRAWVEWLTRSAGGTISTPLFPSGPPSGRGRRGAQPLTRQAASTACKQILAASGISRKGVAVHALRHAVGVMTLRATGNIRAVQARLGHSDVKVTETYATMTTEDYREAAAATRALFEDDDTGRV
jgi:integrase/recombinase XerD